VGIPGLIVAALFSTVREPIRRGRKSGEAVKSVPIREVGRYLFDNRAVYAPMFLGLGASAVLMYGNNSWLPTFFNRALGWGYAQAGVTQGIVLLVAAPLGLMTGAAITERLARTHVDANVRITALAYALTAPLSMLIPLMPSAQLAIALFGLQ